MKYVGVFLIGLLICVYALTIRGVAGNLHPNGTGKNAIDKTRPPFETSMERGRYAQVVSLANEQTFNIDAYAEFVKPDLAWYNGHFYPAFPPGVAFIAVPFYMLGSVLELSQVFTFASTTFFAILTAITLLAIAKKLQFSTKAAVISVFIFTLASCAFAYTVTFSAHIVSSFLISFSFLMYLLVSEKRKIFFAFLALWLAYGLNFFVDYPNLFILLPIIGLSILKVVEKKRDEKGFHVRISLTPFYAILPLLVFFSLFVSYSLHHYQKPIAFTNTYNLKALEILGVSFSYDSLSNDLFDNKKAYATRFDNFVRIQNGMHILLTSHDRGLFFYSPIFLLALVGFTVCFREKSEYWKVIFLTFLADVLLYGSFDDAWGGWGFGPRYLIPTLPLLAIMAGRGFDFLSKKGFVANIGVSILLLYSFGISLLGSLTTNSIPPSVEAKSLQMSDNFLVSWKYLIDGQTSSFAYNTFLQQILTPLQYYIAIFSVVGFIMLLFVWIKRDSSHMHYEITK